MSGVDEALAARFADAQARIKPKTGVGNADMLQMYALFKQATVGDATGDRPGMLDVRARAKFDAWAARRGTSAADAMRAYIAIVDRLLGAG